jgi:hypothetical protein
MLVDTGYLKATPEDPEPATVETKQYRYVSADGKNFGLLFRLKAAAGGNCVTGVGVSGQGWWFNAQNCPF